MNRSSLKHPSPPRFTALSALLALAMLCLVAGCAQVKSDSFTTFAAAVDMGQKGIELSMSNYTTIERDYFIKNVTALQPAEIDKYRLTYDEKRKRLTVGKFTGSELFLDIKLSEEITALSAAFKEYATVLQKLAALDAIDQGTLTSIEGSLNSATTSASSLAGKINADNAKKLADSTSFSFAHFFQDMSRMKQRDELIAAMKANQNNVANYFGICKEFLQCYVNDYKTRSYEPQWAATMQSLMALQNDLDKATAAKNQKEMQTLLAKKKGLVAVLTDLNLKWYNTLRYSKLLEDYFDKMPVVHESLRKDLEKGKTDLSSLQQLVGYAQNIYTGYVVLSAPSAVAAQLQTQ